MCLKFKKVLLFLTVIIFIINTCLVTYFFAPPLLIHYTSTTLDSLKRIIHFQTELNNLGQKLKVIEVSQPKWAELYKNHSDGVHSKINILRSVLEEYIQDYNGFDVSIYDVYRQHLSEITIAQKERSQLSKNLSSVSQLRWQILYTTNDYMMWVFDQEIDFFKTKGIILNYSEFDDSIQSVDERHSQVTNLLKKFLQHLESYETHKGQTLMEFKKAEQTLSTSGPLSEESLRALETQTSLKPVLEQAKKIRVFLEKEMTVLLQTANRVEEKRNELNRRFEELGKKESGMLTKLHEENQEEFKALKALGDLHKQFNENVMLRRSVDLDKNQDEL